MAIIIVAKADLMTECTALQCIHSAALNAALADCDCVTASKTAEPGAAGRVCACDELRLFLCITIRTRPHP